MKLIRRIPRLHFSMHVIGYKRGNMRVEFNGFVPFDI